MSRRSGEAGERRRSRSRRARRYGGGAVIAGSAAGALWALSMGSATAPQAHADLEDLIIQPVIDAVSQAFSAVDPGLLSSLDSVFDLGNVANALELPNLALSTDLGSAASVPLQTLGGTEPIVDLSVNGGAETPVLVDTGSNGLVIPVQDFGLQTLSFPTGLGFGAYSGGLEYFYLTFDVPVTFDGISTESPVDVALFEFPTNFSSFLGGTGDGILGLGPNSFGPGPEFALPNGSEGVLVNEVPGGTGTLEFGANPLTAVSTLNGAPIVQDVYVSIGGSTPVEVPTDFDSGGVNGAIPESALPASMAGESSVPANTLIQVYGEPDRGDLLYSYTTTADNTPTVVSSGDFDTGAEPFLQGPIYIDFAKGETIFDYSAK